MSCCGSHNPSKAPGSRTETFPVGCTPQIRDGSGRCSEPVSRGEVSSAPGYLPGEHQLPARLWPARWSLCADWLSFAVTWRLPPSLAEEGSRRRLHYLGESSVTILARMKDLERDKGMLPFSHQTIETMDPKRLELPQESHAGGGKG